MKLSVSLPTEDVTFLDEYASERALGSRSAALQAAIRALRHDRLAADYTEAWSDWRWTGEADLWDRIIGDGLVQDH